ncbi:hypothetical protein AOLI_G00308470 [Acnodon oligacanthus]
MFSFLQGIFLRQKDDLYTIFNKVSKGDIGRFYFRIEAGRLKYTYRTASVSINVRDSPPKPTLSLYRDQMEVQDRRVLEGSSLENNDTKTTERSLVLCVLYAPRNVSVSPSGPVMWGTPVSLSCSSDGNPAVNYTWYRENGEQMEIGPSLTITETDETHKLDIHYAPRNMSVSVSPSGPVMLGSSVTLSCSSDGNPAVNYTWYRENGEQIETGPSLTITETDETQWVILM